MAASDDLWNRFNVWAVYIVLATLVAAGIGVPLALAYLWQHSGGLPHLRAILGSIAVLSVAYMLQQKRRSDAKYLKTAEQVKAKNLNGHPPGTKVVMGFRRESFTWTAEHIPGKILDAWQQRTDAADEYFELGMGVEEFEKRIGNLAFMPDWVDWELLDRGCSFFVRVWPFVFFGFSWALLAGFGAESASAVLLKSRYWASHGEQGRLDTWKRLRETACWLHDIAMHGKKGFSPGSISWKACIHVRYLHCRTRATIWKAGDWDKEEYGQPINQVQVIGTLLGSSVLLLRGMEELVGLSLPSEDKEAFIHLWRVIGFLFGIEDELNPNRSVHRAQVALESVFTHGIPEFPDRSLTAVLTQHICESVAFGIRTEFGAPVTASMVGVSAWYFVGAAYGKAIGLPEASFHGHVVGFARRCLLRFVLLIYLLVPGTSWVFDRVMRYLFNAMALSVRKRQPQCRFGATCPFNGSTQEACPHKM
eukprot:TRINITY_DN5578_c0_g3_i1.p1 TRINITY_DN5578_c0_g3~~TRINITY_DN5578_c0_g3_i1.p1  ORF type:complete len:506 (-),score=60.17 TRINITY_DN5578_c0_g3_i1:245-1675(-)